MSGTIIIIAAIVCLLITAIILLRASWYVINNACSKFQKTLLSKEYETLKSGDIILFAPVLHNFTNSLITQNLFSHIGMLVDYPGMGLCITESNGSTKLKKSGGAHVFKLLARLKNYDGCFYLMRLNKTLDKDREKTLIETSNTVVDHPYPNFKTKFLSLIGISDITRHCFQHTGMLLEKCKLLPEELEVGFISSADISSIYKYKLPDGYSYDFPVQIIYDIPDNL